MRVASDTRWRPVPDVQTYRTSRTVRTQVRWRDWRTLACLFVALSAFLAAYLSSHTSLRCDRNARTCVLARRTVAGSTERTIPLAEITGAHLKILRQARYLRAYQMDLSTPSGPIRLSPAGSDEDMQAFVESVNAYVRSPAQSQLDAAYGSIGARLVTPSIVFGAIFLAFVYFLPAVRVTADPGKQVLAFDIRPFGRLLARRRTYPLGSVLAARVSEGGTPSWVELSMIDGTTARVVGSTAPHRRAQAIAAMINGVLRRPT
jgi:hypothetical protein